MEQLALEQKPSPRLLDRVRAFHREALAEVFELTFDDLYLYVHALVADHAIAERVAEDAYAKVLDRLPAYTGEVAGIRAWALHQAGDAVRRVPRGELAGTGLREAIARLGRFEHEAITLRLVAGLEAAAVVAGTGRRTSSVLSSQINALRELRAGSATLNPLSLPAHQRQLDVALDRLLAGEPAAEAAAWAPLVTGAGGLLAAASGLVDLPREPAPPQSRARLRGRFLAAAEERRAGWFHRTHTPAAVPGRKPRKEPSRAGTASALALAMVLAVLAGLVLSVAAAFSDPSSDVYPVKRLGESTLVALSTDRVSKADLEVKLAAERLKEAESMASARRPDLAVQAMNSEFDDLRAAASDLAGIPNSHRDQRWKSIRDRLEAAAAKPVTDLERTLTAGGYKQQAAQLKQSYERFQNDHKAFDKGLGVGAPQAQPSAAPLPGATPSPK
jgi:hypothetical protein